jgi:protein-tyrosine phosphatase
VGRPDVAEIVPGLYIGSAPTTRRARALARAGVTDAVDLRVTGNGSEAITWPEAVTRTSRPLTEFAVPLVQDLDLVSIEIARMLEHGGVVFVHCREGVQRSPMVACAVLLRMGWSLAEAYRLVSSRRPVTAISEGQLRALKQLESQINCR